MLLIFLTAGAFVGVVGRSSAQSVAYFMLDIIPARFAVAVLFVVACFVSTAMGTSVGTITLIMPIALEVAQASGFDTALCTGSVVGGAMFGDNLSFISDTTIAACNGQGCAMKDKFKGNFWIALPAAIATLVLILLLTMGHDTAPIDESYDLVQIIPYVLVLAGGCPGINVFVVLLTGIVSGAVIMLLTGQVEATGLLASMGNGAAGMFETSMVAILVAAMCALIRVYGGFDVDEMDAARAVKQATVPILIIHGESDSFVPCEMSDIVSENPALVTRCTFPGADHGFSYLVDTPRYKKIVTEFAEKALAPKA